MLLAGLLLLAGTDAPRSHAGTAAGDWRATIAAASSLAVHPSAVRARELGTSSWRPVARLILFVSPRAFTLDLAAPASSPRATLARIDGPTALAIRGYDATAPPTLS